MHDVHKEAGFSKTNKQIFTNGLNTSLPPWVWPKNTSRTDSLVEKKFQAQQSVKKLMLTVFRDKKRTHHYWFLRRRCDCTQNLLLPTTVAQLILFIQQPSYNIRQSVQSQVESYQRFKKCYLMPPCLTLSIIRIKGKLGQSWEVASFPTSWCSSYRKGSLRVTLNYGRQLYFLLLQENTAVLISKMKVYGFNWSFDNVIESHIWWF